MNAYIETIKNIIKPEQMQQLIDINNLKKAASVLRALNHNLRQAMIQLLEKEGKLTVTEIYIRLRLEQSVASQHLALLRRAGVVVTKREGKNIFYSIDKNRITEIGLLVKDLTSNNN